MKKGMKILALGVIGVLLLMVGGCSDSIQDTVQTIPEGYTLVKGITPAAGKQLTVQDSSGNTLGTTTAGSNGTYQAQVPATQDMIVIDGDNNKVVIFHGIDGDVTYADKPSSKNTELADLLKDLKASGNSPGSIELQKYQLFFDFFSQAGKSFKDTFKEIWNADQGLKQLVEEYKIVSGWSEQYRRTEDFSNVDGRCYSG